MFPPPSCSQKCVGFHVLQAARSHPSCVSQSKATTSGVSQEKRKHPSGDKDHAGWEGEEQTALSTQSWERLSLGPDMPAARGTSSWSDSDIFPAADSEEPWDEMETHLLEESWFTLKKTERKPNLVPHMQPGPVVTYVWFLSSPPHGWRGIRHFVLRHKLKDVLSLFSHHLSSLCRIQPTFTHPYFIAKGRAPKNSSALHQR